MKLRITKNNMKIAKKEKKDGQSEINFDYAIAISLSCDDQTSGLPVIQF